MDDRRAEDSQLEDLDASDQILYLAQADAALNHPNSESLGCPDNVTLSSLVNSGVLPDEALLNHLLHCSPCFRSFRRLKKEATRLPMGSPQPGAFAAIQRGRTFYLVASAATLSVALVLILVTYSWISEDQQEVAYVKELSSSEAQSAASDTYGNSSDADTSETRDVGPRPDARSQQKERIVKTSRTVLINTGNRTRRGEVSKSSEGDSVTIPRTYIQLKVWVAPDSPPGLYVLSVLDEFGRDVLPKISTLKKGIFVTAKLDAEKLIGPARVCVGLKSEIPECSPVTFGR